MLKEATLVTSSGVPIWVRSTGPSVVNGILAGAMLGALSMFSSEITGQLLRSVEMSDGFRLHIRPFGEAEINLAIIGDENVLSDPELLKVIDMLEEDINLMYESESSVDLTDTQTTHVYLEKAISFLDTWFGSRVFVQSSLQKAREEQVVEVSSRITVMTSRFLQENVAILVLDASLESVYANPSAGIREAELASLQAHLKGWLKISSHMTQLLPELLFFKRFCVGLKALKRYYLICVMEWEGASGNASTISKVKSWISTLSRRLGP